MKAFTTDSVKADIRMAFIVCRGHCRRGVQRASRSAEGSAVAVDGKIDTTREVVEL